MLTHMILSLFGGTWAYSCMLYIRTQKWCWKLKLFLLKEKNPLGCWWPGDAWSQGINIHAIDRINPEFSMMRNSPKPCGAVIGPLLTPVNPLLSFLPNAMDTPLNEPLRGVVISGNWQHNASLSTRWVNSLRLSDAYMRRDFNYNWFR